MHSWGLKQLTFSCQIWMVFLVSLYGAKELSRTCMLGKCHREVELINSTAAYSAICIKKFKLRIEGFDTVLRWMKCKTDKRVALSREDDLSWLLRGQRAWSAAAGGLISTEERWRATKHNRSVMNFINTRCVLVCVDFFCQWVVDATLGQSPTHRCSLCCIALC